MAARNADSSHPSTVLVLGGGSEIAAATVSELARRGLDAAYLAARSPAAAEELLAGRVGQDLEVYSTRWDATDVESHDRMLDGAFAELGRVDVVLCAVGMLGHHAGLRMPPAGVDDMVRANFAGPASVLAAAAQRLRDQGSGTIVVLSSVAGQRARRSNYVYGSSKAGLDVFAQGLGDALVGSGVKVCVVRPGFVTSKMTEGLDPAPLATDPATVATAVADGIAAGREVVSVPRSLGPAFALLRNAPRGLWRRIAGDR